MEDLEGTINNLLAQDTLRWIFVGGKGGVGKTTCSCSIAIQLAKCRESVLLISTDPAHNLSDAFGQKFTREPTLVNGFSNLSVVELDAKDANLNVGNLLGGADTSQIQEILAAVPGIDEALGFTEMMRQIDNFNFSVVVFDTAPTGHTLRLLGLPAALQKGLSKLAGTMSRFSPMISQVSGLLGMPSNIAEQMSASNLDRIRGVIDRVNEQFKDPNRTTFVCVCIAEFLSLYETERLIQELAHFDIDTHNIIVNQLVERPSDSTCNLCEARVRLQSKYLDQIRDLYEDFHIIKLPLLNGEVRGTSALETFSARLTKEYTPSSLSK